MHWIRKNPLALKGIGPPCFKTAPDSQVNQARQSEARRLELGETALQTLRRLELLRLLQRFLCHVFVLPLNLPLWGDACLYAIGAPLSTVPRFFLSVVKCALIHRRDAAPALRARGSY